MRKKNTKIELAQKNNTRVIYCNTPETQILIELVNSVDMLYKHIRKNAGVNKISSQDATERIKQFMFVANSIENFLCDTAKELNVENLVKKSFMLQNAEKLDKKQGEQE